MSVVARDKFLLWVSQGFGIGRIPFAPGTFGSIVGVLWFLLLLWPRNVWILAAGILAGFGFSVWICGESERILARKDPGNVVMDEITAMPVCFLFWTAIASSKAGLPEPFFFLERGNWLFTAAVFALFRVFDIAKPWPVRQSQALSGGWGVTVDDFLAAIYVNVVFAAGSLVWTLPRQ